MDDCVGTLSSHNILKVPIAKVGSWAHPEWGEVSFTPADFDRAISNFSDNALGFEPHITFGHLDEEPNSTDSARKRGDLKYLVKEGDYLDGYFAVSPTTAAIVADGGYEYASGEFIRNLMDKGSGEYRGMAVSRVALTNTPYLPWGKEGKVQLLLSQGNGPIDTITSVIKLSQTPIAETPILQSAEIPIAAPINTSQGEQDMSTETLTAPAVQTPPSLPSVAVPTELAATPAPITTASVTPGVDIDAITAAILAQVKAEQDKLRAEQEATVTSANALVEAMRKEMTALTDRLAKAETEASAFNVHASRAAHEAEAVQLMSMGASAVLVNQYTAIKDALNSKATVVKLSQGGVEKESSLMESIRDLLVGALKQTPVVTTQMGLVGGPSEQEGGVEGFLKKVIQENRQKATKVAI